MNNQVIEIYPRGTVIETIVGKVTGVITGVCIRGTSVTYEVSYFDDKVYVTIWMAEGEFKVRTKNVEKQKIGFMNNDN